MNYYIPKRLLSSGSDAKTVKGEKKGWVTYIMYMSPFTQNSIGVNVCSHASAGCAAACLVGSGRGGFSNKVTRGRQNKTEFFLHNREGFLKKLYKELILIEKKHKGEKVAVRLNGTSDISWEKFKVKDNKNLFELFPSIQFYDYTKNHLRFDQKLPKNYSLVFSRSETNHDKAIELLNRGVSVAMVFDNIPKEFEGFKVINGDETDLRFLDKKGVIVGLKYKVLTGKGANNNLAFDTWFAIRTKISQQVYFNKFEQINQKHRETYKNAA
ncbi:MAG: hypothetical protein KatS3mg035_1027 [Bacteroidia bacterium]|nr:MAG: hypothetical protein KatS3mg035_1027 [Bacteroidia bacterium]